MKTRKLLLFAILSLLLGSCGKEQVAPTANVQIEYTTKLALNEYYLYRYTDDNKADMQRVRVVSIVRNSPVDTTAAFTYKIPVDNLEVDKDYVIQFMPNILGPKPIRAKSDETKKYTFN